MTRYPLTFPFGGRSDAAAHSDQPMLYTRAARNVRGRCPVTGRVRGARRSGLSKWNETRIAPGRIKALASTSIDDRKLTYSFNSGTVDQEWAAKLPSKGDARVGRVDRQGNVYVVDGNAGVVKFNSAGVEVMKVALPVVDASHVVRALWVDEQDRIFAGVSEGGDVRTAAVWCVLQLPENQYQVLWTLTPGAYTEELVVYRGTQLYAAHNYTLESRARVVVYENIVLAPTEAKRVESVAYPIHGFDVREDGTFYCASAPNSRASGVGFGSMRSGPGAAFSPPLVGWMPTDDSTIKVWSWYDAEEIDTTDVEGAELVDGAQVLRWRDKSGNNRDLYAGSLLVAGEAGPEYVRSGIGGKPCVRFDTGRTTTTLHSLVSLGNPSVEKNLADQQRSMVPGYTDSMWCMFIVLRPSPDSDATTPSPRTLLSLENEAGGGASDHVLFINRDDKAAPLPGAVDAGFVSYYAVTDGTGDGGAGAGGLQAQGFEYGNANVNAAHSTGCLLITIMWDGGVAPNDTTKTRCLVRYNGQPIDRFEGLAFETTQPTWLGAAPASVFATGMDAARRFKGEIAEIIVCDRRDRFDNTTEPKVLTHDQLETGDPNTDQTDNQVTRIEGYLAYKWGIGQILPNDDTSFSYQHFYGPITAGNILLGPPAPVDGGFYDAHEILLMPNGLVSKHDAQGTLRWAASSFNGITASGAAFEGGYGWGVRARKMSAEVEATEKIHVWSAGPTDGETTGTGNIAIRKLIDEGDSFTVDAADGAWAYAFAGNPDLEYEHPRLAADEFGNLYLPGYNVLAGIRALTVFSKDGSSGAGVVRHTELLPGSSDLAFACALPPDALTPEYRDEIAQPIAEVVYVFATAASIGAEDAVYKIRLTQAAAVASGTTRSVVTLAVTEDDVRVVTETTNTIASGGSAVIDAASQYVTAFRAGDSIIVLDGVSVLAYDLREGTLAKLEACGSGEVPQRPKLGMFWRHRLVLGNLADAPGQYVASKLGDIKDWDLRISNPTATQAFAGSATRAGESEEAITAMIPVWDDLAFICGDSRILRLTGDPQDGGNIHKVTDSMGVAWDAWCKDAQGRVFIFGTSPPGLYQLVVDGDPVPLSRHTLEESEFEAIDLSTHRMVLAWNPIDRGVHIFRVSWAAATETVDHWFWEEKTHRLVRGSPVWTDRFYAFGKQPSSVAYLGGDDSRHLLLGCEDGYLRKWDPAARGDDGDPVDAFVIFDLMPKVGEGVDLRLASIDIALASDQEGARLELFASDEPDDIGPIQAAFDLAPGKNGIGKRLKGAHIWARLRSAGVTRWAFEQGAYEILPAGRSRQKAAP
jgi:hypothetical protein